jgi:hypothetical protein
LESGISNLRRGKGERARKKKYLSPLSPCPLVSPPLVSKTVVVNYARYKLMIEITLNLHFCFPWHILKKGLSYGKGYALKSFLCRDFILNGQFVGG